MELIKYKILLEKYFEGSSSLEEEKALKHFLQSYHGNDEDLNEAKQIFGILVEENSQTIDIDFEKLINKKPTLKIKQIYVVVSGIAASLIIGLLLILQTNNQPIVYAYINGQPITDKEIAIEHSKQALAVLSAELNKGTTGLNYINEMNKPVEIITNKTPIEGLLQTK